MRGNRRGLKAGEERLMLTTALNNVSGVVLHKMDYLRDPRLISTGYFILGNTIQ